MPEYSDSLRGYAYPIHKRDRFLCRFCGVDGASSFATWLGLSQDHLLPRGHADRDNEDFIVTACAFCNGADNRYFDLAGERGLSFDGLTPKELIEQRRPYVENTRSKYREFWEANVSREKGKS